MVVSSIRRFPFPLLYVIQNPCHAPNCLDDSLQILEEQIKTAYEPAPESCAVNGQFHCCSNCDRIG